MRQRDAERALRETPFRPVNNSPFHRHCGHAVDTRVPTLPLNGTIIPRFGENSNRICAF